MSLRNSFPVQSPKQWVFKSDTDWGIGQDRKPFRPHRWKLQMNVTTIWWKKMRHGSPWSFEADFFSLRLAHKTHSGTSGGPLRAVNWHSIDVAIKIPAVRFEVIYTWPEWLDTLEEHRQDVDLIERQQAVIDRTLQADGCPKVGEVGRWNFVTSGYSPERAMAIDGQVQLVRPKYSHYCDKCKIHHGVYEPADTATLDIPSRRQKMHDAEREAEQDALALALLQGAL